MILTTLKFLEAAGSSLKSIRHKKIQLAQILETLRMRTRAAQSHHASYLLEFDVVEILGQHFSDDSSSPVRVLMKEFGLTGLLLKLGPLAFERLLGGKEENNFKGPVK